MRRRQVLATAAAFLPVAGCTLPAGSDDTTDETPTSMPSATATPSATASPSPTPPPNGQVLTALTVANDARERTFDVPVAVRRDGEVVYERTATLAPGEETSLPCGWPQIPDRYVVETTTASGATSVTQIGDDEDETSVGARVEGRIQSERSVGFLTYDSDRRRCQTPTPE
ncbi:hypothetical protein [Haloglomus salinum]|uniref:hypothetical protein n=1 Tax=Haloglomus salinum TaxID=2962673 RepID=UPI0020CA01A1|nr:hypothetical protein [Haloglomus salinum]